MPADQILAFLLFAVVAAMTPGPSNIILASMGATVGVRRGLPCLFGVTGGMALMMFLVAFGLGGIVLERPLLLAVLKWGGLALLLWLAWRIATAGGDVTGSAQPIGFWQAAALQWVNPKSWVICASAVGTFLTAGAANSLVQATYLGGLFLLAALPSCFGWLACGATIQRLLRTPRAVMLFNRIMAVLLAGSLVLWVIG